MNTDETPEPIIDAIVLEVPFTEVTWDYIPTATTVIPLEQQQQQNQEIEEPNSSYLHDLIRQTPTPPNHSILSQIASHPTQAQYVSRHTRTDRTPLHEACLKLHNGNIPPIVIEMLLLVNVSAASWLDEGGNSPLHLSFFGGNVNGRILTEDREEVVKMLVEACPEAVGWANRKSGEGGGGAGLSTPLHLACDDRFVSSEVVKVLLDAVANRTDSRDVGGASLMPDDGVMAPHHSLSSFSSVLPPPLDALNRTPLARYCEAQGDDMKVAELLIEAYPDSLFIQDSMDGKTPLHVVSSRKNSSILIVMLQFLEQKQQNSVVIGMLDRLGRTVLHAATSSTYHQEYETHGDFSVVSLLLRASPELTTVQDSSSGRTALHYACRNRHPSVSTICSIVDTDPSCVDITDRDEYRLALHEICDNPFTFGEGLDFIARALLEVHPEGANYVTKKGDTPLHLAVRHGLLQHEGISDMLGGTLTRVQVVLMLVDLCPEAIFLRNDYGFTPLHCACRSYRPDGRILNILLDTANKIKREEGVESVLLMKTNSGDTALHLVCNKSHVDLGVIQVLLQHCHQQEPQGATNATFLLNKVGNTPLHNACFNQVSPSVIHLMASHQPQWLFHRNNAGYTPLHLASKSNPATASDIIRALLSHSSPTNNTTNNIASLTDSTSHLPLHSACRTSSDSKTISSLISAYPPGLFHRTSYGDLPLHLACIRNSSLEVIQILIQNMIDHHHGNDYGGLMEKNGDDQSPLDILMNEFRLSLKKRLGCGGRSHRRVVVLGEEEDFHQTEEEADLFDKIFFFILGLCSCLKTTNCHNDDDDDDDDDDSSSTGIQNKKNTRFDPKMSIVHSALEIRRLFGSHCIDESYIRRSLSFYPQSVRQRDPTNGEFPLHIEAGVRRRTTKSETSVNQVGCSISLLEQIVMLYPQAAQERDSKGRFPLQCVIASTLDNDDEGNGDVIGRTWEDGGIRALVEAYPPALLLSSSDENGSLLEWVALPFLLERVVSNSRRDNDGRSNVETLFRILRGKPDLVSRGAC